MDLMVYYLVLPYTRLVIPNSQLPNPDQIVYP